MGPMSRDLPDLPGAADHLELCLRLAEEALGDGDGAFGSVLVDSSGAVLRTGRNREVSGSDPNNDPSQATGWFVTVDFKGSDGSNAWRDLTAEAACAQMGTPPRRVAIVLDDEIISSPEVVSDIQTC